MNPWLLAVIALLPPMAVAVFFACGGRSGDRLAAVQLATALAVFILVLMSFALDQSTFIDLPLTLALLSFPGTSVLARLLGRWL